MGSAYQIQDQGGLYFFTCQILGWVGIFSRQINRDEVEVILVRPWRNPCPVW